MKIEKIIVIGQVLISLVLIPRFISTVLRFLEVAGGDTVQTQGVSIILIGLAGVYLITWLGVIFRQRWAGVIAVVIGIIDLINVYKLFENESLPYVLGVIIADVILIWAAGYLSRKLASKS